jgi:hypothetical protein
MGPPSYMRSVVDRNAAMRRMTVQRIIFPKLRIIRFSCSKATLSLGMFYNFRCYSFQLKRASSPCIRVYTVCEVLWHSDSLFFHGDPWNNGLLIASRSCLPQFHFHNSNLYLFLAESVGKFFHSLSESTTKKNTAREFANRYFQGCTNFLETLEPPSKFWVPWGWKLSTVPTEGTQIQGYHKVFVHNTRLSCHGHTNAICYP